MLAENFSISTDNAVFTTSIATRRIGLLYGFERSFPDALKAEINRRAVHSAQSAGTSELPYICDDLDVDVVEASAAGSLEYDVIFDRISHDVPCYQPLVKLAALRGTQAVLCDPALRLTDDKFLQSAICTHLGIKHPKTFLIPSKLYDPTRTTPASLSNLVAPLSFDKIHTTLGFPYYVKPAASFGWDRVTRVNNARDFMQVYDSSGTSVLVAQQEVRWKWYIRCVYIDGDVYPALWDPTQPHQLRYKASNVLLRRARSAAELTDAKRSAMETSQKQNGTIGGVPWMESFDGDRLPLEVVAKCVEQTLKVCSAIGYAINTVEWAIEWNGDVEAMGDDGVQTAEEPKTTEMYIPYVIDMLNSVPDFDRASLGQELFEWVVRKVADLAIRRATAADLRHLPPISTLSGMQHLSIGTPSWRDGLAERAEELQGVKRCGKPEWWERVYRVSKVALDGDDHTDDIVEEVSDEARVEAAHQGSVCCEEGCRQRRGSESIAETVVPLVFTHLAKFEGVFWASDSDILGEHIKSETEELWGASVVRSKSTKSARRAANVLLSPARTPERH
ncbi:hypothetical protein BJ742DRAFT_855398 [Cladochytrium replicatum]|nr:hypothetical protein BJ742DRAFT_855398 [Cladochytrium replicatum]